MLACSVKRNGAGNIDDVTARLANKILASRITEIYNKELKDAASSVYRLFV